MNRDSAPGVGTIEHANLPLWKGHFNLPRAESLENGLINLRTNSNKGIDGNPGLDGDRYRRISQQTYSNNRWRVLQDFGIAVQDFTDEGNGVVNRGCITDANCQVQLANGPVIVQNFPHNFPIGNHDPRTIGVNQCSGEKLDGAHLPRLTYQLNVFSHSKRFGENDVEACHQVGQHVLHGQPNPDA